MSDNVNLNLKKFSFDEVPDGAICTFIGKRKSGKSFCIRDLLFHKKDIPMCKIVSGSEEANPFFSDFMPSTFIDTDFDAEKIETVISRQQTILKKMKKEPSKYGKVDPRMLILFDDCLHDKSWQKSKAVKNIFMNGRHYKIFFILAMQYVLGIPPALRTNIDYVFIFRDSSLQNRRKIYECFGGAIPTFDMFCQLMESLDKYECLVICNDADRVSLEEQIMWYKAKDNGDFKFGSKKMWDFHHRKQSQGDNNVATNVADFVPKKKNTVRLSINKFQ
jgi:hypothetical protein